MFDSNGNSGGVLTDIYSVAGTKTGANASCISTTSPSLTVTSNATSTVNTCDLVQLSVSGGKKPYTISVAQTNSEHPTNTTFQQTNDDVYSWVNNVTPGNQVILSVFDSDGNYGQSTPAMKLAGSTNTHCTISSFSSTNSTSGNGKSGGSGNDGNDGNKSSSKTGIIAGVVIAAFFAIFFGLIAWFFLRRRKQKQGGVRESRRGWTIDRSDSLKAAGGAGRMRLPSDPNDSDITPFTIPTASHTSPTMSVHGYTDLQATPFTPEMHSNQPERPYSQSTADPRSTYFPDQSHLGVGEVDEQDAYAMDAFRMSSGGSSSVSQGPPLAALSQTSQTTAQSSRGFRVVNDEGNARVKPEPTKTSLAQQASNQPPRPVFQHQDAGIAELDEIPPAYPGPSTSFAGQRR